MALLSGLGFFALKYVGQMPLNGLTNDLSMRIKCAFGEVVLEKEKGT
jgi:hypothetical protein